MNVVFLCGTYHLLNCFFLIQAFLCICMICWCKYVASGALGKEK